MICSRHRRHCFTLIIAAVSLLSAGTSSALARRAYSYGSSSSSETVTNSAPSSATAAASSKSLTKDDVSTTVHKAPSAAKKVATRKHTDAHVDTTNADEDSILNVFAPAPIDIPPAKISHNKTSDKSVVVAGAKKTTE
jgi:hypothetical protein